jgi:hypothetical protein
VSYRQSRDTIPRPITLLTRRWRTRPLRTAERLDGVAPELRELVEEQDAVVQ